MTEYVTKNYQEMLKGCEEILAFCCNYKSKLINLKKDDYVTKLNLLEISIKNCKNFFVHILNLNSDYDQLVVEEKDLQKQINKISDTYTLCRDSYDRWNEKRMMLLTETDSNKRVVISKEIQREMQFVFQQTEKIGLSVENLDSSFHLLYLDKLDCLKNKLHTCENKCSRSKGELDNSLKSLSMIVQQYGSLTNRYTQLKDEIDKFAKQGAFIETVSEHKKGIAVAVLGAVSIGTLVAKGIKKIPIK